MPSAQELKKLSLLFLSWRIFLFFIGAVAPLLLLYRPSFPYFDEMLPFYYVPQWIYSWANFDGVHYLTIADRGYVGTASVQAFFPLLPFVILHGLRLFFGPQFNSLVIGLLITNIATLIGIFFWFAFVKKIRSPRTAWISTFVLLLFPTSFFLAALYTESLFFLLVIGAFFYAEKKAWFWAGIFALFASATRIVGVFLVPALLIELTRQDFNYQSVWKAVQNKNSGPNFVSRLRLETKKFIKKDWLKILWLMLGVSGAIFYMVFLDIYFQDPFYFAHVQASFGAGRTTDVFVTYPQVLYRAIRILVTVRPFDLKYWSYMQEFLAGTLTLLSLGLASRYVRFSHLFFALAVFIVPTITGTFSSMPRYILLCFPLYIAFAELIHKHRKLGIVWLCISASLLIINTILFIQGYWVA